MVPKIAIFDHNNYQVGYITMFLMRCSILIRYRREFHARFMILIGFSSGGLVYLWLCEFDKHT